LKAIFACLLLTPCASIVFAATAADQFGVHRWPSEPKLGVDLQPDLCRRILGDVVGAFTSVATDLDIGSAVASDFSPPLPTSASDAAGEDSSPLLRLDLDLDGTGHKQVVIYRNNPARDGAWHYAYVFPSAADFDSVKSQIARAWFTEPLESQYPPPDKREFSGQQYYPSALTSKDEQIQTGDVWADHSLLEANRRFYFVDGTTAYDRETPAPVKIFRLHANGRVEVVCKIDNSSLNEVYRMFTRLPAVGSLLSTIRMIGAGGNDGGTMHPGQIHDAKANAAEIRASYRPWATSAATKPAYEGDHPYYLYDERTRAFLEAWSRDEIWNRREYQTLMELIPSAEASYADYLQSAFGVPANDARLEAVKVIQALIGARLEVPNQFTADRSEDYFPSTPLHDAVMRRDGAAFDAALANPQSMGEPAVGRPQKSKSEILSDAVLDAVEWPYGLDRLLTAGADPNSANEFGKTPLMTAAHFDRPDAAQRLIKAGADLNTSTHRQSNEWLDGPKIYGRTALMYAAENASPATIKVLLDAGADPTAKDSQGRDMSSYLNRNPRFTAAERSSGLLALAKTVDQFSGPSYSCSKARTTTEKAICGSEVLRIFDAQVARAFSAFRTKAGSSAVEEQRMWLQSRDQSCAADVDCLAEKLRTHLRYLLERLSE
jgi:uncharacterized protein YecT (DUF1311 family)